MAMKIKLIDVETDEEEVEFGTCELCFSTGTVSNPVFVFKTESGKSFKVNGYEWSWGDYSEVCIDNVVNFSAWLERFNFKNDLAAFDENWLWQCSLAYEYHKSSNAAEYLEQYLEESK